MWLLISRNRATRTPRNKYAIFSQACPAGSFALWCRRLGAFGSEALMKLVLSRQLLTRALALAALTVAGVGVPSAGATATGDPRAPRPGARGAVVRDANGMVREPRLIDTAEGIRVGDQGRAGARFQVTIPVCFPVITDGETGAVADSTIAAQMAAHNKAFADLRRGEDRFPVQARRRRPHGQRGVVQRRLGL